jgi:tRNA pseudouridine38-40 synthase
VHRYKLTVAYDGTAYCGWQKQEPPHDALVSPDDVIGRGEDGRFQLRTVQEVLERAVREVVREPITLLGASRTDSGVHARGQVAAFTCSDPSAEAEGLPHAPPVPRGVGWPLSRGTDKLVLALNSRLPNDVLVVAAEAVAPTFDPISDCTSKGYTYSLFISPTRPLFERDYVHHLWTPLDVSAMQQAAERFVGEHDFAAFATAGHGRLTTVRTVHNCAVELSGAPEGASPPAPLRIHVSGSGFLYNMVRIIAGTLVEVGRGKMTPDDVVAAMESKDRRRAGPTFPARGLCLEWVRYDRGSAP